MTENDYDRPAPRAASLPTLTKRAHVRVQLPPSVSVYARLRLPGSVRPGARAVVNDISAGGAGMTMIEGSRYELPAEGQEIEVGLDYEGAEAQSPAQVVRSSTRQISVAFPRAEHDGAVNVELLSLMARIVTRRVEYVDRARFAGGLAARLTDRHFYGAGYLDVRVQTEAPAWWQAVFLDYLVAWSQRSGAIETGIIDRSFGGGQIADPLAVTASVVRHSPPWSSLMRVAAFVAGRCAAALPAHAAAFALMQEALIR